MLGVEKGGGRGCVGGREGKRIEEGKGIGGVKEGSEGGEVGEGGEGDGGIVECSGHTHCCEAHGML